MNFIIMDLLALTSTSIAEWASSLR